MISISAASMKTQQKASNALKWGWAAKSLKRSACILASLIPLSSAYAEENNLQKVRYDVFASGFHVLDAKMEMNYVTKGRYEIGFTAKTHGFLGALVPWSGGFSSEGWVSRKRIIQPEKHESSSVWRGEKEVKTYTYTKDGKFVDLVTLYDHKKPRRKVPKEELTKDTTDALAAALQVMEHVSDGNDCEGESIVFDGKRRFKMVFRHKGFVKLEKTRYNAYEGPAAECTMEVVPIEGAWHKKPRGWFSIQEQGREKGQLPTLWLAQVSENAVVVPVRIRVKTEYGTLFAHMTNYESPNKKLKVK